MALVNPPNPTCAESTIRFRQINALAEKLALHFWLGVSLRRWRRVLRIRVRKGACAWEVSYPGEERGLGGVGLGDTSQTDIAMGSGGQQHIVRGDACEFFEDRARRISEA